MYDQSDKKSTEIDKSQDLSNQDSLSQDSKNNSKIPATVWQIGCMMFLMNLSYVIAYSFSGIYIKQILKTAAFLSIGRLEGLCEAISYLMKLASGLLSDAFKQRKSIMIIGYLFSVISKPLLGLTSSFEGVLTARVMERFGNGIQASPRDAIVADVAPKKRIGASYGLKRSLAYAGSFVGGFAGIFITRWLDYDFPKVFLIASIPAFFAFTILLVFVKEPKQVVNTKQEVKVKRKKFSFNDLKNNLGNLGTAFWAIIIVNLVFMLARMNEQFLILRCLDQFVSDISLAPTVMIVMNCGAILASYPIGLLGDKLNRTKMMFIAVIFLCLSDSVMYLADTCFMMYAGIFLWGLQVGASQNVFYSLIAEKVPSNLRGTGLGVYWFVNAVASLFADNIAGIVAHFYSTKHVFITSGVAAVLSLIVLVCLMHHLKLVDSKKSN